LALSNLKNREKDEEHTGTEGENTPDLKHRANHEEKIDTKEEEKIPNLKNRARDEGHIDTNDTQDITTH